MMVRLGRWEYGVCKRHFLLLFLATVLGCAGSGILGIAFSRPPIR